MCLGFSTFAIEVTVTPGELSSTITNPLSVTSLTVNGSVNAADLEFISTKMRALQSLDLSGSTIAEYSGDALTSGIGNAKADAVPAYSLVGLKASTVTLPAGITEISDGAFAGSNISTINFPTTVTKIGDGAFSACNNLTNVTIPSTVTQIGRNAFNDCTGLTNVTINSPITAVPAMAFARCTSLSQVTLPSTIVAVDSAAFANCTSLTSIDLGSKLVVIGPSAFRASGLTAADLSNSPNLTIIGDWAFASAENLATVSFPEGLMQIGKGVFYGDKSLTSIVLPESITEVPDYAFTDASSMNVNSLGNSFVTTIGDYALKGWDKVQIFALPDDITHLGDGAMADWTSLDTLSLRTSIVPSLGDKVWEGVDQKDVVLNVYQQIYNEIQTAEQWKDFTINIMTGVDVETTDADTLNEIKAFFSGTDLIISATSDIAEVRIYDINGSSRAVVNPHETRATIDTEGMNLNVYIVLVKLENGTLRTLKLARV